MNTPKATGAAGLCDVSRLRKDMSERAAAKADRDTVKALEQAEKLQRHGDHEQPGDNRQNSLAPCRADRSAPGPSYPCEVHTTWPERAGERAEEAVGRQPAHIVEQVALDGRDAVRADRGRARRQSRRTCRCSESCPRTRRRISPNSRSSADHPAQSRLFDRDVLLRAATRARGKRPKRRSRCARSRRR